MSSSAQKLVSGSILRVMSLVAAIAVSFFMTPFIIHSLGDKMYGFWVFVATFIGYYGVFDFGLSNAVGRHMSRFIGGNDPDECNRVFNTGFVLFLGIGLLVLIVTIVAAYLADYFVENQTDVLTFQIVFLILGFHTAIDFPMRAFHGVLHAKLRFDVISYIGLLNLTIKTVLVIVVLKLDYALIGLALASLISSFSVNILYVYSARKCLPEIVVNFRSANKDTARMLFSYSVFVFILQIATMLRFQTDAFVITAFIGLSAVAHYNIAGMLIRYFDDLMGRVMGVLTPYFSQLDGAGDDQGIFSAFLFASKISIAISSFVGFGFIVWGRQFIERWLGRDYLDAYPCLVILVVGVLFSFWQTPSIALLYGTSKHRFLAIVAIIEGFTNLFLSLILVNYYGLIGVALGTTIPLIINKAIIQPKYVCRTLSLSYSGYLKVIFRGVFSVGMALCIPILMSLEYSKPNYLNLIGLAVISSLVYSVVTWYLLLTLEEKRIIRTLLSKKTTNVNVTSTSGS